MSDAGRQPCCDEHAPIEAAPIENPAGLDALAYRVGRHGTFKAAMQKAISGQPALAKLTVRQDDDASIALLDAWSASLDVLSFYQERIANEAYLRTATERRSVLELARAIGYELSPGVAASAYLAFQLESAPGAPPVATIDIGTKAQSIPAQGELPQTFETVEKIEGRAAWNSLRPRLSLPQVLESIDGVLHRVDVDGVARQTTELLFAGTTTGLKAGQMLLVVLKDESNALVTIPLRILSAVTDHAAGWTRVTFEQTSLSESRTQPPKGGREVGSGSLFDAPSSGIVPLTDAIVRELILGKSWTDTQLSAISLIYGWKLEALLAIIERLSKVAPLLAGEGVFALTTTVGFFGHNAPYHGSLLDKKGNPLYANDWDGPDGWEIWRDPFTVLYHPDADVHLERVVPGLVKNSWVVFERSTPEGSEFSVFGIRDAVESSVVGFGLSGKVAALKLSKSDGGFVSSIDKAGLANFKVRTSSAHVASEMLALAEVPLESTLDAGDTHIVLNAMVADLKAGQLVALSGERSDAIGVTASEILTLTAIAHAEGFTTLFLASGLVNSYVRSTIRLNANVARATHGETRTEVLGSGDGSRAFQAFRLKQRPLTYISAATPNGRQSTLAIRVNGVLWSEVPSLLGCGASDRVYVTRTAEDGTVNVKFGDGHTGARLPTGVENVTATYRVGSGVSGAVDVGQISLLVTRSLGLSGVTNPVAASGAADAESLDQARTSAPLTVLTMDRIVSLQDYEDFARGFAGIAKAQVALLWLGDRQVVHLTIAGVNGSAVEESSALHQNLSAAIEGAGHIERAVEIDSYQPLLFSVSARVLIDESHGAADVLAAVDAELKSVFSFERRSLGQSVLKSEVLAAIQDVAGVIAVDLDALYLSTNTSVLHDVLPARRAAIEGEVTRPAELLTLHPAGITLTEML